MSESRQVRRARERADAKAVRRGPEPTIERTLQAQLSRHLDDPGDYSDDEREELGEDPEAYARWGIEWWVKGSTSSTAGDSSNELQEVIDGMTADLSRWGEHYRFELEWILAGDPPADGTLEDAVVDAGVVLPLHWPAPL